MHPTLIHDGKYKIAIIFHPEQPIPSRAHVFVLSPEGRAQVWLTPKVEIANPSETRLTDEALADVCSIVEKHLPELMASWDA